MHLDDAENNRHPETGTFSYVFGCKKRVKHFILYCFGHAYTIILKTDHQLILPVPGLDGNAAFTRRQILAFTA